MDEQVDGRSLPVPIKVQVLGSGGTGPMVTG